MAYTEEIDSKIVEVYDVSSFITLTQEYDSEIVETYNINSDLTGDQMGKLHVGDTLPTLRFDSNGADLTNATGHVIKFLDPLGKPGTFPGTIEAPATAGFITYKLQSSLDLYKAGIWKMWTYITMSSGDVVAGEVAQVPVYEQGT